MKIKVLWQDLLSAIGLLSRIPVSVDFETAGARQSLAVWAYPLAGLVIALPAFGVALLAEAMGLGSALGAALALCVMVVITGALHDDGLADCADGIFAGKSPEQRLEIMKDSRIGAYGALALIFGSLITWAALERSLALQAPAVIIAAAAFSRAVMVCVMGAFSHARKEGLSVLVGRPPKAAVITAIAIGVLITLTLLGPLGIVAMGLAAITAAAWALYACAKLGGQTGDVLGATQKIAEIGFLIGAICALSGS